MWPTIVECRHACNLCHAKSIQTLDVQIALVGGDFPKEIPGTILWDEVKNISTSIITMHHLVSKKKEVSQANQSKSAKPNYTNSSSSPSTALGPCCHHCPSPCHALHRDGGTALH